MLDSLDLRGLQLVADILRYYFLSTLITILCYGIYLPLFLKSVLLISPRLRSSIPSRWLLALILVLFVPTTMHLVAGICAILSLLQFANAGDAENDITSKLAMVAELTLTAFEVFYYTGRINILLIDVIVVWRAYVLQPHRRWLRILLINLLIFTLLFSGFLMVVTPDPERYYISESLADRLNIARGVIALSVTVIGAVCIGLTAREFQKSVKESQFRHRTTPFVARTFRILVEGCIILTLLQIAVIGLALGEVGTEPGTSKTLTSSVSISFMLLSEIAIFASAIHPCLVTVLVSDESYRKPSATGVSETKLSSFAVTPPTSSRSTV
ncbi:hypothetical protein DL96DRAFT_243071 [Flagelloscypha sp. PMI_526]|nr:hypothetical protein DL96DRAFT_243071 [Flagelloscypha sp. PMI_526]